MASRLASTSADTTLKLWDAQTGQELRTFRNPQGDRDPRRFSTPTPRGWVRQRTITASRSGRWRRAGSSATLRGHRGPVVSVWPPAPTGDSSHPPALIDTLRLWDPEAAATSSRWGAAATSTPLPSTRGQTDGLGQWLLRLAIADPATGQPSARALHRAPRYRLEPGRQAGGCLEVGTWKPAATLVALWDAETGKQVRALGRHAQMVRAVALSRDGSPGRLRQRRRRRSKFGKPRPAVYALTYLTSRPNCCRAALPGVQPGTVASSRQSAAPTPCRSGTWTAAKRVLVLPERRRPVLALAFSQSGRLLASACGDGMVRVWDRGRRPGAARPDRTRKGRLGAWRSAPTAGGSFRGENDRTVKLWDMATGDEVLTLRGHNCPVTASELQPPMAAALSPAAPTP